MNSRFQCVSWSIVIIAIDQLTKYLVVSYMYLGQSIPVVGKLFHITFLYNTGAAFSILRNQIWLLASLAIIASISLLYFFPRLATHGKHMQLGAIFLLGGTVGNLIDRLLQGSVIDFIDFRIWPVFNVADSAICIGAALVALSLFRASDRNCEAHDEKV
ncbi:MAG: signal peptidase II [Bacillota bacterium]